MNKTFRLKLLKAVCLALVLSTVWVTAASAAIISDLRNTGLTSLGAYIPTHGTTDGNYTIISSPAPYTAVTIDDTTWPIMPNGPWVINNPTASRWIGPARDSYGLPGNYIYRTTFTLPPTANLGTVNISGLWGTDDPGLDILINGGSTGNLSAGFTTLVPFSVTNGFAIGVNTLDFVLSNAGGPTGLRVDRVLGTYVPEPASAVLVGLGGVAVAGTLRRRRNFGPR